MPHKFFFEVKLENEEMTIRQGITEYLFIYMESPICKYRHSGLFPERIKGFSLLAMYRTEKFHDVCTLDLPEKGA